MSRLRNKPARSINTGWVKARDGGICRVMLMNGAQLENAQTYWLPQDNAWLSERERDPETTAANLGRWRKEVAVTLAQLKAYDGKIRVLLERSENDHTPVAVADLELRDGKLWLCARQDKGDIAELLSGHGVPEPWNEND